MTSPSKAAKPLGPLFRWLVLAIMSLICFAQYYIYDSITPLGTIIKEQLNFSGAQYGLLFSFYAVANVFLLMLLVAGVLVDKLGIKISGLLYGGLCVLGALLTAVGAWAGLRDLLGAGGYQWLQTAFEPEWSPELKVMLLGRMIFGIGAEAILVVNNKVLARWFIGKELAFAYGLNLTIMRLGTFLALTGQSRMASWLGLGPALWFAFGIMSLGLLSFLGYMALERFARGRPGAPEPEVIAAAAASSQPRGSLLERLVEALKALWHGLRLAFSFDASFWFITLLCFAFYSAVFPFQSYAPDILVQRFGYSVERSGDVVSALIIGTMIFTPLFGSLVDWRGRRATLMVLGALLIIPCHLLIGYTHVPPIFPIFVVGVALSLVPAALWAAIPLMVPQNRLGTAFGVVGYLQNVGLMLFPWFAGKIADAHTVTAMVDGKEVQQVDYTSTMLMFAGLGLAGFVFALMLRGADRRKGSPLEAPSAAAPSTVAADVPPPEATPAD